MTKQAFINELERKLWRLSPRDREERISFYSEMIDDHIEEGMSEAEAIQSIGSIDAIVCEIFNEQSHPKAPTAKESAKRSRKTSEIVLLVLGSPLWLSLVVVAFVVIVSLVLTLWSVVATLWSLVIALPLTTIVCIIKVFVVLLEGHTATSLVLLACSILATGLTIFAFLDAKQATRGAWWLTRGLAISLFRRKEKEQ